MLQIQSFLSIEILRKSRRGSNLFGKNSRLWSTFSRQQFGTKQIELRFSSNRICIEALRNKILKPDFNINGFRGVNSQVNRTANLQVARIAVSLHCISQLKGVLFCCVITLRAQRGLFIPNANNFCSTKHARLVHAI